MKTFYLTTPIYYVNDVPHIGHAYTTIAADVLARWHRLRGQPVFFLTGTDEHGDKIARAAEGAGESTSAFVDRVSGEYRRLWSALSISYDGFIRTSEEQHRRAVQAVFEQLKSSGDIYKGEYEGWYCVHDESYFAHSELVDERCPSCGREVQRLKEDSYFFRLSSYADRLLDHYSRHPDFLSPRHRANEILNFVRSGLRDLSVSRTRVKWGIPIPSDPQHTVYVWFDALLNYLSAAGYGDPSRKTELEARWPADLHLVGKEIFRFHTVIWPAMLMALGVPLPRRVFAHGWWTVEGTKMSKSLGNVVDPHVMAGRYGTDAFRYFLLREVPFGSDGDFSEKALLLRYNSELANNIGNLLQRTITLLTKNFDGMIPVRTAGEKILVNTRSLVGDIGRHFDDLSFSEALEAIFALVVRANQFIDQQAPWKLGPEQKDSIAQILGECLAVLKVLAITLWPFMPSKSQEIWGRLGESGDILTAGGDCLQKLSEGQLPTFAEGQRVQPGEPLFARKIPPK